MLLKFLVFSTFLLVHQASTNSGSDNQLTLKLCNRNDTVVVNLITKSDSSGIICQCEANPTPDPPVKEDYLYFPGMGSYKLHTDAHSWNDARKICVDEGAHLAIINSRAEEAVLLDMMKKAEGSIRNGLNREEALLGIHDLYHEGHWVTLFGESIYTTGYSNWSPTYFGGQPDNFENRQHCGALINIGGMDDVDCRDKFAFFCELPLAC